MSKEVIVLKEKWNPGAHEAPAARALEMVQVIEDEYQELKRPKGILIAI